MKEVINNLVTAISEGNVQAIFDNLVAVLGTILDAVFGIVNKDLGITEETTA